MKTILKRSTAAVLALVMFVTCFVFDVSAAEKTVLEQFQEKLAYAQTLKEEDYTPESWKPFKEAVLTDMVNNQENIPSYPESIIQNFLNSIHAYLDQLVKKEKTPYEQLLQRIAYAKTLKEEDYTPSSWKYFSEFMEGIEGNEYLEPMAAMFLGGMNAAIDQLEPVKSETTVLEDGTYTIGLSLWGDFRKSVNFFTRNIPQPVVKNALLTAKDESYTLTLKLYSFSSMKSIEILKPQYQKEMTEDNWALLYNFGTKGFLHDFNPQESDLHSAVIKRFSAENDQFWQDLKMEEGEDNSVYITFEIDDLSQDIFGEFTSCAKNRSGEETYIMDSFFASLDVNSIKKVPQVPLEDGKGKTGCNKSSLSANVAGLLFPDELAEYETENGRMTLTYRFDNKKFEEVNKVVMYLYDSDKNLIELTENGTFTTTYETVRDMVFGKRYLTSRGSQEYWSSYEYDVIPQLDLKEISLEDPQSGTILLTNNYVVSESCSLKSEEVIDDPDQYDLYDDIQNNIGGIAKNILAYCYTIENGSSKITKPSQTVTMKFKIPESWDKSRIRLFSMGATGPDLSSQGGKVEGDYFVVKTADISNFALYEEKTVDQDAPELSDGTYTVPITVWHVVDEGKQSMSSKCVGTTANLIVKDGVKTMCLDYRAVTNGLLTSYMTDMWYYDENVTYDSASYPQGELHRVTFNSYFKYSDGSYFTDIFNEGTGRYYPKTGYFELPTDKAIFPVRFRVPVMDGFSDTGDNSQDARFAIDYANIKKLSDDTPTPEAEELPPAQQQTVSVKEGLSAAEGALWIINSNTESDYHGALQAIRTYSKDGKTEVCIDLQPVPSGEQKLWITGFAFKNGANYQDASVTQRDENKNITQVRFTLPSNVTRTPVKITCGQKTEENYLFVDLRNLKEYQTNKNELEEVLSKAESFGKDSYTTETYAALLEAVKNAGKVNENVFADQTQIDTQTALLKTAIAALMPSDKPGEVKKLKLRQAVKDAKAYQTQSYTEASLTELLQAISQAEEVLSDNEALQESVDAQVTALSAAIAGLIRYEAVLPAEKSLLTAALETAESFTETDIYTEAGTKALQSAILAAEAIKEKETASQNEVDTMTDLLNASVAALVLDTKGSIKDGTYTITALLRHSNNQQDSMGNAALVKPSILTVKDNAAVLTMDFQPLTIAAIGKGYLAGLQYLSYDNAQYPPADSELIPMTVEAEYIGVYDSYNDPENGLDESVKGQLYPKTMSMPVSLFDEEIWVQVYVPIMESISVGSGTQYARLQLDWDNMTQNGGTEEMTRELQNILDLAVGMEQKTASDQAFEALTSAADAGRALIKDINITQEQVECVSRAIQAAIHAVSAQILVTDKGELKQTLTEAGDYLSQTKIYTAQSLAVLQIIADKGQAAYENENTTQLEIDARVSALKTAIQGLNQIIRPDVTLLNQKIGDAKEIQNQNGIYTKKSYASLQTAIQTAQAEAQNEERTEESVQRAITELQRAAAALIRVTVKLDKTSANMTAGESLTLKAVVNDEGTVQWVSSNPGIVSVDKNGTVKAAAQGTAVIKASVNCVSASCSITVKAKEVPKQPASLTLSKTKLTLYTKGLTSAALKATVTGSSQKVTWKSSKTSVVTVSNGKISVKKAGKAIITATANGISKTCTVTVKTPALKLNKTSAALYTNGNKTITLKASVTGANSKVTWKSSNEKVAAVKNGKVTAKKSGTVTIKATANGITKSCKIVVKKQSLTLKKASAEIKKGKTVNITAKAKPAGKITYSTSNSKVAKVNSKGSVKAKNRGTAIITVTCNGYMKRFTVRVK